MWSAEVTLDLLFGYSSFRDSKHPKPPPGTKWKEVRHDNKVTWLVSWTENIQGSIKYIMLNPSSRIKVPNGTVCKTGQQFEPGGSACVWLVLSCDLVTTMRSCSFVPFLLLSPYPVLLFSSSDLSFVLVALSVESLFVPSSLSYCFAFITWAFLFLFIYFSPFHLNSPPVNAFL